MRGALALLLLAGCAAPASPPSGAGGVEPRSVILYRDTVTLSMTDGTLCRRLRPPAGAWAGPVAGCPHPLDVAVPRPSGRARTPLALTAAAPWVTVTGPGGTRGWGPS